jgi:hypothetical protein
MSSRELALQGQQKGRPSDVESLMNATNKGAELAVNYTPKFAKRGLTGIKHIGEKGVAMVTNSRLGRYAADKVGELAGKQRFGAALSFNAGKKKITKMSDIKTIGDLANIDAIAQLMLLVIGFLFFIIFWWIANKLSLNEQNCKNLKSLYTQFPKISTINPTNPQYQYRLRDYYIKTAYNCCAGGNYKNDFVNLCALKTCIQQGARCLDFEIFSVDNLPVIATSSIKDYTVKETYNYVSFAQAMEVVSIYAFSGGNCPNPDDPMILHFRIMSNNTDILGAMAIALYNTLQDRLLGPDFSYENNGRNMGAIPITYLMGKVAIIVDKSNALFTGSPLNEYVNLASNAPLMRTLRFRDVKYTHDMDELMFYNKMNMTLCLPDLSAFSKNFEPTIAMTYGCQMIAMSFQNFDTNMEYYTEFFDSAGSAFVLRPEKLRFIPVFIPIPTQQSKAASFGTGLSNPLGPNGPASLNMYIKSDYGEGSQCSNSTGIETATASSTTDSSGNATDSSGNAITDSSGNAT